jgi:hypothetical protein
MLQLVVMVVQAAVAEEIPTEHQTLLEVLVLQDKDLTEELALVQTVVEEELAPQAEYQVVEME